MPLFSRKKDRIKKEQLQSVNDSKVSQPRWEDSWLRTRVDPEEVAELLHGCTVEIKSRGLDVPFLLLPFRPSSDPSAAKTFVRNYFLPTAERKKLAGHALMRELKMSEVMVLVAVMKWCWARLPGGVVTWEAYHGFNVGERDSRNARNAFSTFIPMSVESKARISIINDYFDLLAALAAHGKSNGFGGYKLSRYAGWWAFEHFDTGKGFDAGYKLWNNAADATCHLFFAYLRSQTPEPGSTNGILDLPRSLQQLVDSMEYPPLSASIANDTTKVVMIVDTVSPTPFALLRRAKQFEYRDDDMALQHFAEFEDPVQALTEECRRVLRAISSTNQSQVSNAATSTSLRDPSWSRFEDIGFGSAFEDSGDDTFGKSRSSTAQGLTTTSRSPVNDLNRPTTPSWADFLSSGFTEENGNRTAAPILLPPDKALPPIAGTLRGQSSQSHRKDIETTHLEPGELASIARIELDDAFWWVWISSLAGEEPVARKAAFGRCAVIETSLLGGQWMIMEEQVKGAAPEPAPGAYVAERKSFFSFTKRGRLGRRKSAIKKSPLQDDSNSLDPANRVTLDQDKQARIQRAAAELARKKQLEDTQTLNSRRGRNDENAAAKTNSVFTLGPVIKDEASPAMQWAKQYDKKTTREAYLGNVLAGKGSSDFLNIPNANGSLSLKKSNSTLSVNKDLPHAPGSAGTTRRGSNRDDAEAQIQAQPSPSVSSIVAAAPETAPAAVEAPVARAPKSYTAEHRAVSSRAASEKEQSATQSKQSSESRRSGRSTDKPTTERSRLKKIGFNAPPPVATNKNGGIKKMFGTLRKTKDRDSGSKPQPASLHNDEDPAIAAARRALEGKAIGPSDGPQSPPLSPNHFARLQQTNRHPVPEAPAPDAAPPLTEVDSNVHSRAPVVTPKEEQHPIEGHKENLTPQELPSEHHDLYNGTRNTNQDDFADLSQIDSHERADAAKEFSRFDQGPLTDQPAFAGHQYEDEEEYNADAAHGFEPPMRPQHQSVYSTVTMQTDATDEESNVEYSAQTSAHDRWAQIRRNAAERAARASEDHQRSRTETRTTDDGETSGEETIESRVARIKARVAELTGNMEATRR